MTGLIYVILIALWGVVLVPRWLRHHDHSRRHRENERIQAVLAPDPALGDGEHSQSWSEYLRSLTSVDTSAWLGQIRMPQSRHARRRRMILMALGGTFGLSLLGAVAGFVPGFVTVLSALLLALYVSAMFLQMRQWEQQRTAVAESAPAAPVADPMNRPAAATDGVRVRTAAESGASWDPRETTLPMYASKPKASKIPRRIDLTREGWTGAGMVAEARRQQASPQLQQQFDREFAAVAPDPDAEVAAFAYPDDEDQHYYRRAVNE